MAEEKQAANSKQAHASSPQIKQKEGIYQA
jgi:hypothetical protein